MANPGDIVITEFMPNPSAVLDTDGEWLEFYNTTASEIDLSGWTISDGGTDSHTITSLIIPAGGVVVLGRNSNTAMNGGVTLNYTYANFTMANTGDEIVLTDNSSNVIDSVVYTLGSTFPLQAGASLELGPTHVNAVDNDNGANWAVATAQYGVGDFGTPGVVTLPPNTAPTNITLSNASVREFAATGTDVGVLSATDAQGGAMTYALLNSAGGRFKITGNVLEVDNGLLSDFEQDSTHSVQVRVTDSGGLTFTKTLNLTLTDINPEVITGTAAAETFFGGAGADTLKGEGGNDTLRGNGGADRLEGGTGNDKYFTDGLDTIIEAAFSAGGGIDTLYSSVSITLPANVEILRLEGSAAINGTGTGAPESIIGNSGINTLTGGGGADTLNGKSGNDIIIGGAGRDTLIGEAGNDRFKFNATADSQVGSSNRDFINGFVRGEDKIDLSAIDANPFAANDQVFTFKGTAAFGTNGAASAGQLRISFSSANFVILDADVQGDGIADMQIVVSGVSTLGTSDFVL